MKTISRPNMNMIHNCLDIPYQIESLTRRMFEGIFRKFKKIWNVHKIDKYQYLLCWPLAGYVNTSYNHQYLIYWPGMLAGYVNTSYKY